MLTSKKLQKYLNSNDLMLGLALVIAAALVWNTVGAMQKNYRLEQKYDRLRAEVELQEIENQNLRYKIAYLKTNGFLELAARDKFGKAAPGETLVYLPESGKEQRQAVASPQEGVERKVEKGIVGNLKAWLRFLSGNSS